jgi:gamma-glutamyltranspeptidase
VERSVSGVQPLARAQFVSNLVDFGMNVKAAMETPRFAKNNADAAMF